MTDQLLNDPPPTPVAPGSPMVKWVALIALLFSFGLTMLLFSVGYARDLDLLRRAPELVWAFICGQPNANGVILPLLLTLATVSILVAVSLSTGLWISQRRSVG